MDNENLITIIEHGGTRWERNYVVNEKEKELLEKMMEVANEIKAFGQTCYAKIPEKKCSMTGLGNRILRTAHDMMEDFNSVHKKDLGDR